MPKYEDYLERKKAEGKKPLSREAWERRVGHLLKGTAKDESKPSPKPEPKKTEPKPEKMAEPKGLIPAGGPSRGPVLRETLALASKLLWCIRHSPGREVTLPLKDAHTKLVQYRRRAPFDYKGMYSSILIAAEADKEFVAECVELADKLGSALEE